MFRIYTLYTIAFLFFLTPFYSLFAQCPDSFDDAPVTYGQTTNCQFDSTYFFHLDTSEVAATLTVIYRNPITGMSEIITDRDNLPPADYTLKYRTEGGCSLIKYIDFFPFTFSTIADQCLSSQGVAGIYNLISNEEAYSYSWNTGDTAQQLTDLSAGNYDLTINEANATGCIYVAPFVVEDGGMLDVLAFNRRTDCNGSSGSLQPFFPFALSLNDEYDYLWSTGDTTIRVDGLAAGEYVVTITNRQNSSCFSIDTFTVESNDRLSVPNPVITHLSCAEENGSIVFPTEGMEGVSVNWNNGDTTISISGLAAGSYAVTFTNEGEACSTEFFFDVYDYLEIFVEVQKRDSPCGEPLGRIDLITYNANNTRYEWENGDTTSYRRELLPGEYTVLVFTGDQECPVMKTIVLNEIDQIDGLYASNEFIPSPTSNAGVVSVSNSYYDELAYSWNTGDTTSLVSNLPIGEYEVTVTFPNGTCPTVLSASVISDCQYLDNLYRTSSRDRNCNHSGAVELRALNPGIVFIWENGDTVTYVDGLAAGEYYYTIEDTTNGCRLEKLIVVYFEHGTIDIDIDFHTTCNNSGSDTLTAFFSIGQSVFQPATYIWGNGQTNVNTTFSQIEVHLDSVYTLTLISANGCEREFTVYPEDYCDEEELENFATIEFGSTSTRPGDTLACIPVTMRPNTAQNENLASFQGALTYDTSLIEFVQLINDDENFYYNLVETDEVRFVFYNFSPAGSTYIGTTLFTACFRPLSDNGIAKVEARYEPLPWEFVNADAENVYPSFIPGFIDLGYSLVWPGDANRNGTVNHFDLLNIGLANTKSGPERPIATTTWQQETVTSWNDFIPTTSINAAHADTDGNGTVQKIDQTAIDENWTFTTPWYNPLFDYDINYPIQSTAAVPLFIQPDTVVTNSEANFEIHLGTEAYQAQQIYGLAFSISYDDIVINGDQDISIDFSDGWLGTFQEDLIATYRVFHEEQRIDVGITRIDGESLDGHGKIGVLSVTIEDVIFRNIMRPFNFRLSGQRIVNNGSVNLPSNAMETTSFLEQPTSTNEAGTNFTQLEIFPNPTRDRIWFNNHKELDVTDITIYHQSGVLVKSIPANGELPRFVELSELPAGVYFLKLSGPAGVHSLKVVKW